MYINRQLDLSSVLPKKSCFLFGPRQTGKTSLIRNTLARHRYYNLLQTNVYLKLSRAPQRLRQEITDGETIVVIDEIQKLPILLDEAHESIESKGINFLLTGSSDRKLRLRGINLLGGRARTRRLHPFVFMHGLDIENHILSDYLPRQTLMRFLSIKRLSCSFIFGASMNPYRKNRNRSKTACSKR